ncbi:MAG: hypothetical protein HY927_09430 [Elusimicrobia bacterium]|nr:hypothetical protein [Elusimicrobiota bacterium]
MEEFALSGHPYGRLTGVSLAVHAIPDAFLVLHTGVGCKYKGAGQYCLHDLARPSHHREGYTEVTDLALIKGSASRIPIYVRSWYKKRKPSLMAVVSSTFLEMAGEDFVKAVSDAQETVGCPVAYIPAPGFDGDLYDGYAALTMEVIKRIPFKTTEPKRGRVAVVGYPFDRYELDHAGNLQQLRYMLESLGLEMGPVLLSGRPYAELMEAASCEGIVALPYSRGYVKELASLTGRTVAATDLPIGGRGTFRWLRDVAEAFKVPKPVLDAAIARQWEYGKPQMDVFRNYARPRLGTRRPVIFADTPLAAGLTSLLLELGQPPIVVGLRDRSLGGARAFREALARTGLSAPDDLEVVECPSLDLARSKVLALSQADRLAMVLCSHAELLCLRGLGEQVKIPIIEIGFPSMTYHVLYPTPFYGIAGALAGAQRIMNIIPIVLRLGA